MTPSRRWQPAFYPFKKESFSRRLLGKVELLVKGPVFGCRMCGNCLLQETAFICPMECSKGLRNGPCGGVTPSKLCYIDETRKCIWYCIYKSAEKRGREKLLLEVLPPLDYEKVGTETWGEVAVRIKKVGVTSFLKNVLSNDKEKKAAAMDSVFKTIRQPGWWSGDSEYHAPGYSEPVSELERKFRSGEFVVTTEVTPPTGTKTVKLVNDIEIVKPFVTAVNFTDSSSARPRMSSIACSHVAHNLNVEPVLQIAARDTTRTRLQSDIIGINELGVRNVLCITGDSPWIGPPPTGSMNNLDIDSIQMLWILRRMRDNGIYLDGRSIKSPPKLFLGASSTPFASDPALQAIRDHKKVNAGAQFFQTNLIFDPDKLDAWLEQLDKRNLLDKVYILAGISPLNSFKVAEYLHTNVPGVILPEKILSRMQRAGEGAAEEGIQIALEVVDAVKKKNGINGIHIMPLGCDKAVGRIVTDSGLNY